MSPLHWQLCLQTEGQFASDAAQGLLLTRKTKSPSVVQESKRNLTLTPLRDFLSPYDASVNVPNKYIYSNIKITAQFILCSKRVWQQYLWVLKMPSLAKYPMLFHIIWSTMQVMMYGRCLCAPGRSSRWSERCRSCQNSGEEEGISAGSWKGFSREHETPWITGWIIIVWPLVPDFEHSLSSFSEMCNVCSYCNQWVWCTVHYEILKHVVQIKVTLSQSDPVRLFKVVQWSKKLQYHLLLQTQHYWIVPSGSCSRSLVSLGVCMHFWVTSSSPSGIKCPDIERMPDAPLRTRLRREIQSATLPSLNPPERADAKPVQPEEARNELQELHRHLSAPAERMLDSYIKMPRCTLYTNTQI